MQWSQPLKQVVTVSEVARNIGLSRARFYQLVKEGILPQPSRNPKTKRPFYDRQQQEQCFLIRQTNRGANGRPVLFYAKHLALRPPTPKPNPRKRSSKNRRSRKPSSAPKSDPMIEELRHDLGQLGLDEVTDKSIRSALADEYPDGHGNVDTAELLMSVFRRLKRQNSQDNVA